ncbi:DUF1963 domain-containing protein [Roseibium sp.]|uniref:DUF1963 domain-containing protein n=1 Tax=Roseibium sp. TaxID=1936156 RepID=UPI003BB05B82
MSYLLARRPLGETSTNWIGGLPKIEASRWPRCAATGLPLHFLAQIDLAQVPDAAAKAGLPDRGWLSFFADTEFSNSAVRNGFPACVIHSEALTEPCAPPPDLPEPYGQDFTYALSYHVFHPRDRFLCSPVSLVDIGDGDPAAIARQACVSYSSVFDPERDGMPFREAAAGLLVSLQRAQDRNAIRFDIEENQKAVDRLRESLDAIEQHQHLEGEAFQAAMAAAGFHGLEQFPGRAKAGREKHLQGAQNSLRSALRSRETLPKLMAELARIARDGEAHAPMSREDYDTVLGMIGREGFSSSLVTEGLERHMRGVLGNLAFGAQPQPERLPETVVDHWNANPHSAAGPHIFLGDGPSPQLLEDGFAGCRPLLHLACDTVLGLSWGDMGVVQFWMHPDDIRDRAWHKVKLRLAGC